MKVCRGSKQGRNIRDSSKKVSSEYTGDRGYSDPVAIPIYKSHVLIFVSFRC